MSDPAVTTPSRRASAGRVVAVLLVVVTAWGAAFSGIKILLDELSAPALTSGRLLVAALAYLLFLPFAPRTDRERRRSDLPRVVIAGVIASAGYHMALNVGERSVSAGLAALLVASMPAMVAVLSVVFLRERLGATRAAGVGVAFAGVAVIAVGTGRGVAADSLTGVLVTLCAPLAWATYTIVAKPLAERWDGVRLNIIGGWVGAIAVLPFGLAELDAFLAFDLGSWLWLLYLGAVSQAGAYVAYAWALRSWRASSVASAVYLVPVTSMLWAWGLLGEVPSVWAIGGGALIVAGVVVVQRAR